MSSDSERSERIALLNFLNYQAAYSVLESRIGRLEEAWGKFPRRTGPWPGLRTLGVEKPFVLGDFARWLDLDAVNEAYRRLSEKE